MINPQNESFSFQDEEDFFSASDLSYKMSTHIVQAFQERFPVLDNRACYVIFSCCSSLLMSTILSVPEEKRERMFYDFIDAVHGTFKQLKHRRD